MKYFPTLETSQTSTNLQLTHNDGEYRPSTTNIYDVGDGLFLKETIKVDSYGENEEITELQFVQPVTKTVTDYETIK